MLAIVFFAFCAGSARINISPYVTVLELQSVTGKMFMYTSDTSVVCAAMSLIEISGMEFVNYDLFGDVLTIPDHPNTGAGLQIRLEYCSSGQLCWLQVPTAWITLKIFHGISSHTCSAAILRLLIIILEGMIEVCMVGKVGFMEMILDVQFSICYVDIYGHNVFEHEVGNCDFSYNSCR